MEGYPRPTVAIMYEDTKQARHIRTYEINVKERVGACWCDDGICHNVHHWLDANPELFWFTLVFTFIAMCKVSCERVDEDVVNEGLRGKVTLPNNSCPLR